MIHTEIVETCLRAGLTVYYVDKDRVRRGEVQELDPAGNVVEASNGELMMSGIVHTNVLVIVNSHEFTEEHLKELKNIPGYISGTYPSYIYLGIA